MKKNILFGIAVLFGCCLGLTAGIPRYADSSVQGFYAWPYVSHGVLKVSMQNFRNAEFKKKFWENQKRLHDSGRRGFMIIEMIFSKTIPGSRIPTPEAAREDLRHFLVSTPEAKTYPEVLYAVVPSEEHRSQDIEALNRIYDYIHNEYHIPVFQWLSEPLLPPADFKSDGWVFDAYSVKGNDFYVHCRKFMLRGRPVFPVLWASEAGMSGYYPEGLDAVLANARERIAICRELKLPMFWFAVCKEHGSVGCWMSNKPGFPEMRRRFQDLIKDSSISSWTPSVPLQEFALSPEGEFVWQENFRDLSLLDRCAFRGAPRACLVPGGLKIPDDQAVLSWQFRYQEDCRQGTFVLDYTGNAPEIKVLADGRELMARKVQSGSEMSFSLAGRQSFAVVLKGRGLVLNGMRIRIQGQADQEKQLRLNLDKGGIVKYSEKLTGNRFQRTTETKSPSENIRFDRGRAVLLGHDWTGQQKIVFSRSVRRVRMTVRTFADYKNWGCVAQVGLSQDGSGVQWKKSHPVHRGSPIQLELTAPQGFKTCYFHLKMTNGSGVYPKGGAPMHFYGYDLEAVQSPEAEKPAAVPPAVSTPAAVTEKAVQVSLSPAGKFSLTEKLDTDQFRQTVRHLTAASGVRFNPGTAVVLGSQWEGCQKIRFSEAVKDVEAKVNGYADYGNWHCSIRAGLSLDGKTAVYVDSDPKKTWQSLKLSLHSPSGIRECYLHIQLLNGSGVYPAGGAPARFTGYQLSGRR